MRHALLHVVWTEMCVGSVCTQPPYNDKNPPSVFYLFKSFTLSQIEPISDACKCDSHKDPGPSHECLIDSRQTGLVFYLRPALSEQSSFRHCFDTGEGVHKNIS